MNGLLRQPTAFPADFQPFQNSIAIQKKFLKWKLLKVNQIGMKKAL